MQENYISHSKKQIYTPIQQPNPENSQDSSSSKAEPTPTSSLLLCKFVLMFQKALYNIEKSLETKFPSSKKPKKQDDMDISRISSKNSKISEKNAVEGPSKNEKNFNLSLNSDQLHFELEEVSKNLLLVYMENCGKNLSKLVKIAMETTDWLNVKVPGTVRSVCYLFFLKKIA